MFLNFLNTLVLLGALQGFILGSLLFFRKSNPFPNKLLGTLLFLIALASLNVYLNEQPWYRGSSFCQMLDALFPFIIPMPIGPLTYFYTRATLDQGFVMTKRHRIYFLPVLIDLFPYGFVLCYLLGIQAGWLPAHTGRAGRIIDTYNVYADIPRWASISGYLMAAAKYYGTHKDRRNASWIKELLSVFAAFQVLWLVYLIPYIIPRYTDWMLDRLNWYPVFLPLGILTYWLGLKGYFFNYGGPRVDQEYYTTQASLIIKAMEERCLYLDPRLNVDMLAESVGLPAKTISSVLNLSLHKNFNEFVNEYRVRAFQERIWSGKYNHLTIAAIAGECGFNSKATFQRFFKEYTGHTPSDFRKSAQIRI